jgi:hypothetical protein
MKKPKLTPEESLRRIKLMMNYDISRSLNEQTESPWGIAKKTGIATGGAAGAGAIAGGIAGASAMSGLPAYAAVGVGTALGAGGLATAGAIGGAVLGGAAALALTPLVLWLIDKDKAYPKTKKLFEYVKNNKEKIDQVDRGLDDDVIQLLSDDLYNAMKGLGTRNKLVYSVFNSLVTISDLSALISTFNEDHENEGDGDLLEWLDDDFDISSMWNRIYVPVRNLVKKFAKQLAEENMPAEQPTDTTAATTTTTGGGGTYKPCTGTYSFGCESESIRKIQGCLGLVEDGKFGPKTQVKLGQLGKGFDNGFTDDDVQTICSLAPSLIHRVSPPDKASTSNLNLSSLVPKLDKTTLRSAPTQSVSPERIKEIQDNIRRNKKYVGPPLNDAETAWLNDYMKKLTGKTSQVGKEKVKFT